MKLSKEMLNKIIGKTLEDAIEILAQCNDVLGWAFDEDDNLVIEKKNHTSYYVNIIYCEFSAHCQFWFED